MRAELQPVFLMGDCFLASDAAAPLWRFCQGRLRSCHAKMAKLASFVFIPAHTFCEPYVVVDFASPLGIPAPPQKACPRPLFGQQCKHGLQAMCGRLPRHHPSMASSKSSVKCLVTCLTTIDTQRGGQPSSDQATCSGTSTQVVHLKILY